MCEGLQLITISIIARPLFLSSLQPVRGIFNTRVFVALGNAALDGDGQDNEPLGEGIVFTPFQEHKTELGDYSEANQSRRWSWEARAGTRRRDVFPGYRRSSNKVKPHREED